MTTQHTPGPWISDPDNSGAIIFNPEIGTIATLSDEMRAYKANGALLAAAPDLLKACTLALALIKDTWIPEHGNEQVGNAWGALHSAIARAKVEA